MSRLYIPDRDKYSNYNKTHVCILLYVGIWFSVCKSSFKFFLKFGCCCSSGNHPYVCLANFGNIQNMKVEILKDPSCCGSFWWIGFFAILFKKKGNLWLNILFLKYISPNGKIHHRKDSLHPSWGVKKNTTQN
jgi:hypothetical protein